MGSLRPVKAFFQDWGPVLVVWVLVVALVVALAWIARHSEGKVLWRW